MHNFVGLNSHICTNDYQYYYRFLSCTSVYEWLSIFFWVFVMHISVRMIIHILIGFCHAHLFTNDYPYYFRCRHVHLCTNEYPYYTGILSCTFMYEWLSIFLLVFVMHISLRMTIHIILGVVMHIYVRMTIHIILGFRHAHVCTNDYVYYFCVSLLLSLG